RPAHPRARFGLRARRLHRCDRPQVQGARGLMAESQTVECVVKPHFRFGDDGPGAHVFVDEHELKNPATMRALYTLEEAYALEKARAVKREAKSQMRKLVEQMHDSVAAELRDLKERGARRLQSPPP